MATNTSLVQLKYFDHAAIADNFYRFAMSGVLELAGMAIVTGGSADCKIGNTMTYQIGGIIKSKTTATTDLSALITGGTIADDQCALISFYIDAAGTVTASMSDEYALTAANPAIDDYADTLVCFGALKIKNETGSTFLVGTTALDKTGVTTTYYNFGTAFPNMVIGA